jgi:hypothetical protein
MTEFLHVVFSIATPVFMFEVLPHCFRLHFRYSLTNPVFNTKAITPRNDQCPRRSDLPDQHNKLRVGFPKFDVHANPRNQGYRFND